MRQTWNGQVENQIIDVLLELLRTAQSDRMREICLGILGNLACHAKPEKIMVETEGFVSMVVKQLFVNDAPSLSEACRLLSAGLHSEAVSAWVMALKGEEVMERILWMVANTMNSQLLEKSTELLLAMVDSRIDAASGFLPTLLRLGLLDLLTDLLACEVTAINEGTSSCGYEIFLACHRHRKVFLFEARAFLYFMTIRVQSMCFLTQLAH
jgi:hypothetical protein